MSVPGPLLIDRGDLPSLVAVTMESRPQHLVLYHAVELDPAAKRRRAAVEEHGVVLGVRQVVVEPLPPLETGGGGPGAAGAADQLEGLAQAGLLLQAAAAARRLACPRIIWPHQVGPDPEAVGPAVERASLVAALAEIGGGQPAGAELVIDLPLVDLTDAQLADLAEDGGAPMHGFWPCAAGGDVPCGACAGCRRWRSAFTEAGVPWPWAAVGTSS
ncbi:MAG: 7-cyano-7-deazaguanine synthase [Planctomycetota bacterium]|jgi:hypothetical protein